MPNGINDNASLLCQAVKTWNSLHVFPSYYDPGSFMIGVKKHSPGRHSVGHPAVLSSFALRMMTGMMMAVQSHFGNEHIKKSLLLTKSEPMKQ